MTCAEFQRVLPYIIESGGKPEEEEHLRSCPVCGDLVADLRYIADAAKLLVPLEDPHPRVWGGIEKSLHREGYLRRQSAPSPWRGWAPLAAAAVLVMVVALALAFRGQEEPQLALTQAPAAETALAAAPMDPEDEQLLAELEARVPADRPAFETNLRYVNAYIHDARQSLDNDPADDAAWQHLMHAYEQKAMLYEMAISRSLR
jgi:hypothetical protein